MMNKFHLLLRGYVASRVEEECGTTGPYLVKIIMTTINTYIKLILRLPFRR